LATTLTDDLKAGGRAEGPAASVRPGLPFRRRRQIFLILFGAPAVLYVLAVAIWPLAQGLSYSFYDYSLLKPAAKTFVGLENYRTLVTNPTAWNSIVTTVKFTVLAVGLEFLIGLALALLLWREGTFERICLALLLIPVTMTPLVVGLVFRALLAPDYGMIGYYAAHLGLSPARGFFGSPGTALGTLVAVDVWQWTPFMALILLAGLKSLPSDVLEAALADGATRGQRFRIIVFPMLLPAVFLALVLRTMDAFRVFDIVFATTNGGPADATDVLMIYGVKQGLQFFNIGFASAIANSMILCIAVLSVVFIVLVRRADRRANELAV
jgi:multiple sugar transport system permease protein